MWASKTSMRAPPRQLGTACRQSLGGRMRVLAAAKMKLGGKPSTQDSDEPREVVVGIDLGTTNSCIAIMNKGKPVCIPNSLGEPTTPSVVTFLPNGEVLVGKAARRMAATHPAVTYSSVKRLIGRRFADPLVQEELPRLPFRVSPDQEGMVVLGCTSVDRGFIYPEEVSAQVLSELLSDAEAYTGSPVTKAVISVPAYFDEQQKEATMAAGKLAGLETVRILREPVAAALAYGLNLQEDKTVLVFDLGGGTYDISILEVGNGTVEVLATGGDAHLGGDDWDAVIVEWLKKRHLSRSGLNFSDPKLRANLKSLAEVAKVQLADNDEVVLRMPVGGRDGGGVEAILTRAQLDKLSAPLWKRCRMPLDQACWNAGVDLGSVVGDLEAKKSKMRSTGVPQWRTETLQPQIRVKQRPPVSEVLMVGGATRMKAVQKFIFNMTGLEGLEDAVNPDEAVALGAAVQAGILQGDVADMMVMDQWQASLMRALADLELKKNPKAKKTLGKKMGSEEAEPSEDAVGEDAIGEALVDDEKEGKSV
eukprot:gene30049-35020_t